MRVVLAWPVGDWGRDVGGMHRGRAVHGALCGGPCVCVSVHEWSDVCVCVVWVGVGMGTLQTVGYGHDCVGVRGVGGRWGGVGRRKWNARPAEPGPVAWGVGRGAGARGALGMWVVLGIGMPICAG